SRNSTPSTENYTLSLHDALPICHMSVQFANGLDISLQEDISKKIYEVNSWIDLRLKEINERQKKTTKLVNSKEFDSEALNVFIRSEEHTSELQSRENLVCRLLLE